MMYDKKIEERVDMEIASFLEEEYAAQGDGLYQWYRYRFLVANNKSLTSTIGLAHYDKAIVRFVLERCPFATRFVEVGAGLAQESMLVALHGLPAFAIESTVAHLEMMNRLLRRLATKLDSRLLERMTPVNDWFPRRATEYVDAGTVLTFPTLSATMTEEQETHLLDVMKVAGGVILSTEHFFRNRTSDEQATLISQIRSRGFGEPVEVFSWANGDMGFAGNRIVFLKRL
jgi:hypothetical protein